MTTQMQCCGTTMEFLIRRICLGQRMAAQESNWCRPVFLTLNKNLEFCSIYEASDAGKFHVTNAILAPGYPLDYAEWVTNKGFLPVSVQAAGEDALTATFSAIYVENDSVRPRVWSATGAEPGTQISRECAWGDDRQHHTAGGCGDCV